MTYILTIEEAKKKLDKLIPLLADDDVILTDNGIPTARIVPVVPSGSLRQAGSAKGLILQMSDEFDAPLNDFKEYGN